MNYHIFHGMYFLKEDRRARCIYFHFTLMVYLVFLINRQLFAVTVIVNVGTFFILLYELNRANLVSFI
jgi:hypothetical protein